MSEVHAPTGRRPITAEAGTSESEAQRRRASACAAIARQRGRRAPLDALVISNTANIGYLTGFTGSAAILVLTASGGADFITDGRYTAQAALECPGVRIVAATSSAAYVGALESVLAAQADLLRIGFEDGHVTVREASAWRKVLRSGARLVPAAGIVEGLRALKSDGEIAAIRAAARLAEAAFRSVSDALRPGVAERDFALELDFAMRRMGADAPSFDTIVASGPNGAFPHHRPGARAFEAGDLVTIDWGARLDGYCSDITRTVAIPGAPVDETLRRAHAVVLDAKERATAGCVAGTAGSVVDALARDIVTAAGFGDAFKHALGHSLGREVHDGPSLSQRASKVRLATGFVTTVEPGIYLDGLGGVRIEEDVLVSATGPVPLTTPSDALG